MTSDTEVSRNPYHVGDEPPTLRLSVFAWMDMLGYREMLAESVRKGRKTIYCGKSMLRWERTARVGSTKAIWEYVSGRRTTMP